MEVNRKKHGDALQKNVPLRQRIQVAHNPQILVIFATRTKQLKIWPDALGILILLVLQQMVDAQLTMPALWHGVKLGTHL